LIYLSCSLKIITYTKSRFTAHTSVWIVLRTIHFSQRFSGDVYWLQCVKPRCHCETARRKTGRQKTCNSSYTHSIQYAAMLVTERTCYVL